MLVSFVFPFNAVSYTMFRNKQHLLHFILTNTILFYIKQFANRMIDAFVRLTFQICQRFAIISFYPIRQEFGILHLYASVWRLSYDVHMYYSNLRISESYFVALLDPNKKCVSTNHFQRFNFAHQRVSDKLDTKSLEINTC